MPSRCLPGTRYGPRAVVVPVEMALAYTPGKGWHYLHAPAQWWLDECEDQHERDEQGWLEGELRVQHWLTDEARAVLSVGTWTRRQVRTAS